MKNMHTRIQVMSNSTLFRDYPRTFASHSRAAARRYRMRHDCFAGPPEMAEFEGMRVLQSLPGDGLSVYAGTPPDLDEVARLQPRPVYSFSEDDPPAVPSGRVFVQASADANVAAAIEALGYVVESVPPYAPHAAWIVAADGSIATALSNVEALLTVRAIVSAEPQMLRPAATR